MTKFDQVLDSADGLAVEEQESLLKVLQHRLADLDRLCWRVQASALEDFRRNLAVALEEAIARGELRRVPYWTESIAVGSAGFVGKVEAMVLARREMETEQVQEGVWALGEATVPYG